MVFILLLDLFRGRNAKQSVAIVGIIDGLPMSEIRSNEDASEREKG